jgi:hypothetical protein
MKGGNAMCRNRTATRALLLAPLLLLLLGTSAEAQKAPPPRLTHVFPMGGKAGATFELKVTGQDVSKPEGLYFNFPGAKVEVLGADTVKPDPKGKPLPNVSAHRFKVTLPPNAPLGIQDVRVVTSGGISNARAFVVGDQEEVNEQEPNDDTDKAQKIALNNTVNGVIQAPTDVDYYTFTGKKGQRVICSCLASSIDSKLPVAVEMFDKAGGYLGMNRNYHDNDAMLDVTLPADGEYLVRVFGFTYSLGGADYFYRLSVGTTPWIDAVHPSAIEPGREAEVAVYGRNLPNGVRDAGSVIGGQTLDKLTMKLKAPADGTSLAYPGRVPPLATALDAFSLRLKNDSGSSNPYLLTFARAPVIADGGSNNTQAQAQKVPIPCEISGRIDKRGDVDWYQFTAKKGEVVAIEAFGERLGSPVDLFFQIVSEKGTVITEQDDTAETMAPYFSARTDDPPRFRFVAPGDSTYYLKISSRAAFTDASPRHRYLVRLGADDPNFHVIAMPFATLSPDSAALGQFGSYAFNVFVWRLGGFTGDITVTADKLPAGLSVRPQVLSNGQKQAALVVSAAADAPPYDGAISVMASATIDGKKRTRAVRAAGIVWPVPQQNILTVTRLDRELVVAVRDQAPYSLVPGVEKLAITQGEKISVPVKLQTHWADFKGNVQLTAAALPPGLNLQPLTLTPGKESAVAVFEAKGGAALAPGNYSLVLRGQTQPINPKGGGAAMQKGGPMNYVQATPPIELTVTAKTKAK